jgi:hypothetical protein
VGCDVLTGTDLLSGLACINACRVLTIPLHVHIQDAVSMARGLMESKDMLRRKSEELFTAGNCVTSTRTRCENIF